jgi:uncharacterized membrane protein YcaP (DUF421 family)
MSTMHGLLAVVAHTATIYVVLILLFRLPGHRQLAQFTLVDLVVIILIGSAVETAMVNGDTSLAAGLVCASTLLTMNRVITFFLARSRHLRHIVLGRPLLLIHNGIMLDEHVRRAGLTPEDVKEAIREREECHTENVRYAVLETDGTLNVVPWSGGSRVPGPSTL